MHRDMVVSYTRDLLEQITGERPEPDQDGDLPIEFGGACFYVRVDGPTDPVVQIFSVVLADLEANPELHGALNDINANMRFARAFHVQKQVLIESEKTKIEEFKYYNYQEKYRFFVFLGLSFLVLEFILRNTLFKSFI